MTQHGAFRPLVSLEDVAIFTDEALAPVDLFNSDEKLKLGSTRRGPKDGVRGSLAALTHCGQRSR